MKRAAPWACPSCQSLSDGVAAFCSRCGERRAFDGQVLASFRRWAATLRLLVAAPGTLLRHHLDGRRVGQVNPLSLFLGINLAFFVVASFGWVRVLAIPLDAHLGSQSYSALARSVVEAQRARHGLEPMRFADRFEAKQDTVAKAAVIAMVPALALVLWPLMPAGSRQLAAAHVLSLHTFAFLLLFLAVFGPLWHGLLGAASSLGWQPSAQAQDDFLWAFLAAVVWLYLTLTLRRGLRLGAWRSALVGAILTVALGPALLLYRLGVFLLTAHAAA